MSRFCDHWMLGDGITGLCLGSWLMEHHVLHTDTDTHTMAVGRSDSPAAVRCNWIHVSRLLLRGDRLLLLILLRLPLLLLLWSGSKALLIISCPDLMQLANECSFLLLLVAGCVVCGRQRESRSRVAEGEK